jgi:hypothetical protein
MANLPHKNGRSPPRQFGGGSMPPSVIAIPNITMSAPRPLSRRRLALSLRRVASLPEVDHEDHGHKPEQVLAQDDYHFLGTFVSITWDNDHATHVDEQVTSTPSQTSSRRSSLPKMVMRAASDELTKHQVQFQQHESPCTPSLVFH